MKLARVGVIAAAVLAVATLAWAQKTDFSGTWTLDAEASGAPAGGAPGGGGGGGGRGGGRGGLGPGGMVKQTATELTVERQVGENKVTATYKLDGTESKNSVMGRGGAVEAVSVAKWEGPALVIVTKSDMGNGPQESTQKWTLAGSVLTIETTNARGTQKMVYKK
jgi:hypothetical protein